MARGLSPLQRTILHIAWQQHPERTAPERRWPEADIYAQDLYVLHYGWPISYGRWLADDTRGLETGQTWHFCPEVIGRGTYRTVSAAVSRSFHRLARRGYLTQGGNGWSLTAAGQAVAEQLSVKDCATVGTI